VTRAAPGRVRPDDRRLARWVGPLFVVFAVILLVWIAVLAVSLPGRGVLQNEDLVWVGFDVGLLVGLVWTAWAAFGRHPTLPLAAAATGASLVIDAWFDVVGSTGPERVVAVVMALVVELPLSALCWWLALRDLGERREGGTH
jgi:hypothetical protein